MHNPEPTQVGTVADPHVLVRFPDFPAGENRSFDMRVTSSGIDNADELVALLLLVVERVVGVDSDLYVQQIDTARRAAGLGPLTLGALR